MAMENAEYFVGEYVGEVASNCNYTIDRDVEKILRGNSQYYGEYCGWNFHGIVNWIEEKWRCIVSQYHSVVEVIYADSIESVMKEVSGRYGGE